MNLYIFIPAVIVFIIILYILARIILREGLKFNLFNTSSSSIDIKSRKDENIEKSSDEKDKSKDNSNIRPIKIGKNISQGNRVLNKKPRKKRRKRKIPRGNIILNKKEDGKSLTEKTKKDLVNLGKGEPIKKPTERKTTGPELIVKSFEDVYEILKNSTILDLVRYFEINKLEFVNWEINDTIFDSITSLEDFIKSKIVNYLDNRYWDLMDKTSELRKNGKDMNDAEFMLLSVPLKIKLFSATFKKKDFDIVMKRMQPIKELLEKYK